MKQKYQQGVRSGRKVYIGYSHIQVLPIRAHASKFGTLNLLHLWLNLEIRTFVNFRYPLIDRMSISIGRIVVDRPNDNLADYIQKYL